MTDDSPRNRINEMIDLNTLYFSLHTEDPGDDGISYGDGDTYAKRDRATRVRYVTRRKYRKCVREDNAEYKYMRKPGILESIRDTCHELFGETEDAMRFYEDMIASRGNGLLRKKLLAINVIRELAIRPKRGRQK